MWRYFLSELDAGAEAVGVEDAAGAAAAGVDEVSELPELDDVLLLSPDDFGLALP
jgi:hypothetical protein